MEVVFTNILTLSGDEEQIAKVREYIKKSNGEAISIYPSFDYFYTSCVNVYAHMVDIIPDWFFCYLDAMGVEYDSRDEVVPNKLMFNTALTTPYEAMKRLSEIFPEVGINVIFSGEIPGLFSSGEYTFVGGKKTKDVSLDDSSDEAMEYYFLTHEDDRERWARREDGEWFNIGNEEREDGVISKSILADEDCEN